MSLTNSTVFSLLTSSSSNLKSTSEEEDTRTDATSSTNFSDSGSSTANFITTTLIDVTATTSFGKSGSSTTSNDDNLNSITSDSTTGTSIFDENIFNASTSIDTYNSSIEFGNNSNVYNSSANITINGNFTDDLEFQDWEDDTSNNSFPTSTNYSEDSLGDVIEEPTTYVPMFYFLVTILLGIYVYLYFLHRHLKAKASRVMEDDQKKRVEERIKSGGCRYDFEDEDESDYGPPEQNLSVSALRFYGGAGGRM